MFDIFYLQKLYIYRVNKMLEVWKQANIIAKYVRQCHTYTDVMPNSKKIKERKNDLKEKPNFYRRKK
jgi:hypothetical protein